MNTSFSEPCSWPNSILLKVLLLTALALCALNVKAQAKDNVKLVIETGPILLPEDPENLSFFLNVETKVKAFESAFIGLRFGIAVNSNSYNDFDPFEFTFDEESDNGTVYFVPTFDYYLSESSRRPYLGLGVGYHFSPHPVDVSRTVVITPTEDVFQVDVNERIGLLFRGGFESEKFRFGLEYNLIPSTELELPDGQVIGSVTNGYLGLSVGWLVLGRNTPRE